MVNLNGQNRVAVKRYLITGANGFVGKNLCAFVRFKNHQLTLFSREKVGQLGERTYVGNIEDALDPEVMLGVHAVFHLAGVAHLPIGNSSEERDYYQKVNVDGTRSILELAIQSGVKRFVYFSSVKAGGEIQNNCLNEDSSCLPADVYGQSKLDAEHCVLELGARAGIHVCILRPALVYGAGMKGNLYQMLQSIDGGRFPPLPAIPNRRSMISVSDLIHAAWLVMHDERANGKVYIAEDGEQYSSRRIYLAMLNALGRRPPAFNLPTNFFQWLARFGDFLNRVGVNQPLFDSDHYLRLFGSVYYSADKIKNELGWRPEQTFEDALPEIISWYKTSKNK